MSSAAKARARVVFGYFDKGQANVLYTAFSPNMKKSSTPAKLTAFTKQMETQWGHEEKMLGENFAPSLLTEGTVYSRYSQFSKIKDQIFTMLSILPDGQVGVLQFQPAPSPSGSRYSDYQDKTKFRLPFDGDWFVYEGGRDIYQNAHAYRDVDRYSVTFTVLKGGKPFSGDGSKNEDYFCYGQPVLAPADGKVVLTNNTFTDNLPGRAEEVMPSGNRVLIYHGHQEYSLFMHLKQNSIKVKSGEKVKQGDVIGECGSSGNSPVPMVEYRLQDSGGRPLPVSLPAQFVDYVADGTAVASGEPVRGQTVHNTSVPAASTTTQATDKR